MMNLMYLILCENEGRYIVSSSVDDELVPTTEMQFQLLYQMPSASIWHLVPAIQSSYALSCQDVLVYIVENENAFSNSLQIYHEILLDLSEPIVWRDHVWLRNFIQYSISLYFFPF
ncbi:hypothetical protein Droror1_Dr00020262 [Drosera rotundifolia]